MSIEERLRSWLQEHAALMREFVPKGVPYSCMEEFVLREGRMMPLIPTNPKIRRMTKKECFSNSTKFALRHPGHTYAEGFLLSEDLPIAIHHAWVVDPQGFVIDPTLGWRKGAAYMGVTFLLHDVLRRIGRSGYYGLFTDGIQIHDLVLGLDPEFQYQGLPSPAPPGS